MGNRSAGEACGSGESHLRHIDFENKQARWGVALEQRRIALVSAQSGKVLQSCDIVRKPPPLARVGREPDS